VSIEAVGWALRQEVGNSTAKLVLLGFAAHAGIHSWIAWPSRETVGTFAEVGPQQARRLAKDLDAAGFIRPAGVSELTPQERARYESLPKNRRTRLYRVAPDVEISTPKNWGDTEDTPPPGRGDISAVRGDISGGSGVTPDVTQKVIQNTQVKPAGARRSETVDHQTRRDYLDATATTELIDKSRHDRDNPDPDRPDPAAALAAARSRR
jgi:hypothetical protein